MCNLQTGLDQKYQKIINILENTVVFPDSQKIPLPGLSICLCIFMCANIDLKVVSLPMSSYIFNLLGNCSKNFIQSAVFTHIIMVSSNI